MVRRYSVLSTLAVALAVGAAMPAPLSGRQAGGGAQGDTALARRLLEQQLGRGVSQAEILERLRQSGMTRQEARARLMQMGYDPRIADQYFDLMESGESSPRGNVGSDFAQKLQEIGRMSSQVGGDSTRAVPPEGEADDVAGGGDEALAPGELPIFGRSLFRRRARTAFQPVVTGPVDPGYRLGPGDEIELVLTGDVELAYSLAITREGSVVIPDVGQIFVNGLTLGQLRERLYDQLGRVYSGVRRGAGATTRFQLTLGRLRTNLVYLVGEVEEPGTYQVSSLATVFHALHEAGGPNRNGSFRAIQVRRGGAVVRTLDLYDYLLHGDSRADIRLENGDIIFVPPYTARVRVEGAVRRPAIYEVAGQDDLTDVLGYAGGLDAEAFVRSVQIDRILPPERRRPGVERVLVDVDVERLRGAPEGAPLVADGDVIHVFAVAGERRNRVMITGEVRRPATYEWSDGLTLWELIDRASGLPERAYTPRAHIYRVNDRDGARRLIQTALLADSTGRHLQDVLLADRDSVVVYSRERLRNPTIVRIDGFVKHPGTYPLSEGMTIQDLILAAGGFVPGAWMREAEVARRPEFVERTSRTAAIFRVLLERGDEGGADRSDSKGAGGRGAELPVWLPGEEDFSLEDGDRVFIRQAPGYQTPRTVSVTGEVVVPGTYVLETRQEKLLDLLERAGGLTGEAYAPGLQLFRGGTLVATDLPRAFRQPEGRFNLVLQEGDSLHLPDYDPTVLVTGAVTFQSRVLYEPGKGLDYYINRAGGYTELADRGRVTVTYQDGERAAVERVAVVFRSKPSPQPGSIIFVPDKPETERRGMSWGDFIMRSSTAVTSIVLLLTAINQMRD